MKMTKMASGNRIRISKKEWEDMGKKAGWVQADNDDGRDEVDTNNTSWITGQLQRFIEDPESFWTNISFQTGKGYRTPQEQQNLLKEMLRKLKSESPTLEMFSKEEKKDLAKKVLALGKEAQEDNEKEELRDQERGFEGAGTGEPVATLPEMGEVGNIERQTPPSDPIPQQKGLSKEDQDLVGAGIDPSMFPSKKDVENIKNQLLDRYINKEITKDQLKNMLSEFAKKHDLNIKLSKSNGKMQIRISKNTRTIHKEADEQEYFIKDIIKEDEEPPVLISNCCGIEDRALSPDGPSYSEIGICPKCKEGCDFITEETYENKANSL